MDTRSARGSMDGVRVVFMGTPAFAVSSLAALVATGARVVGVVTQPDKAAGRGRAVHSGPVKSWAVAHNLPVYQPPGLKRPENRQFLNDCAPDVLVVGAYGKLLPREVLDLPPHGAVNIHASLLPRHRGPAPVPASLLAGDEETGIARMRLDEGMDTGPIIAQDRLPMPAGATTATLSVLLAECGASLLVSTLPAYLRGEVAPVPQDNAHATVCRLLSTDDGHIDWTRTADETERMIRAFTPWPGVWTTWTQQGKTRRLRIHAGTVVPRTADTHTSLPGMVEEHAGRTMVCAGWGTALQLTVVQLQDRTAVAIDDFIRGHRGFIGSRLGDS